MKRTVFTAIAAISLVIGISVAMSEPKMTASMSLLQFGDLEVLTTCESVGWWDNNGNCVHNNIGTDFCKEDSWHEITDCSQ